MGFIPLDNMCRRIDVTRQESDTALFYDLMYWGEMLTKIVATAMVSAIQKEKDKHRYRQLYRLVRANGIGEWHEVLQDTLNGPASAHLLTSARTESRELTQRCGPGSWQYASVHLLDRCLASPR